MPDAATDGESDHLDAVTSSFGALRDEESSLDRGDGARGAHLERISNP